ncbi:MAG: hypothetical protein WC147_06135 [Syntrophomonas sp.]
MSNSIFDKGLIGHYATYWGLIYMFTLPWYAAIFISIPETFLIILIGFALFNSSINLKDSIVAAVAIGMISLFLRRIPIYPGLKVLILILILSVTITLFSQIKLWYSFISVTLGAMIIGAIENAVMPVVLMSISKNVNDLAINPWLNIGVFQPTLLLAIILFLLIKKLNFVLYDLGTKES